MVKGLEQKLHKEWLRLLSLFSLEEIERRRHCSYNFLMRGREGQTVISSLWSQYQD